MPGSEGFAAFDQLHDFESKGKLFRVVRGSRVGGSARDRGDIDGAAEESGFELDILNAEEGKLVFEGGHELAEVMIMSSSS